MPHNFYAQNPYANNYNMYNHHNSLYSLSCILLSLLLLLYYYHYHAILIIIIITYIH